MDRIRTYPINQRNLSRDCVGFVQNLALAANRFRGRTKVARERRSDACRRSKVLAGLAGTAGLLLATPLLSACDRGQHRVNARTEGVYEVDFRTAIRDAQYDRTYEGADKYFVRHWKLDIPWTYIYAYRGDDKDIGGDGYEGDPQKRTLRTVRLHGLIDWDNGTILPSPERATDYDVAIVLRQGRVGPDLWPDQRCLTFEMYSELAGREDGVGRDVCELSGARLCTTRMQMDGWGMEVAVEREFYESDPQPVCNIVRNFLNELTIERESVMLDNQGV